MMNRTLAILALAMLVCTASWTPVLAQVSISISIDAIEENDFIAGTVKGLQPSEYANYKVIVYVHTDVWYIHPYAGQGDGSSWASIGANGQWTIDTVRRRFSADKMAALVVARDYPEPNKRSTVGGIPAIARTIKRLRGTEDYGKL